MRIAIFSDVHSNREALEAAFEDAIALDVDAYWCLGDVVGYGPDPYRCWQRLAKIEEIPENLWVAGNHDWGLIGRLESQIFVGLLEGPTVTGDFGVHAWEMLNKQKRLLAEVPNLSGPMYESLSRLPLLSSPLPGVYMAHGSGHPEASQAIGTYSRLPIQGQESLLNMRDLADDPNSAKWQELSKVALHGWAMPKLMLVGHTHIAGMWQYPGLQPGSSDWIDLTQQVQEQTEWFTFADLERDPVFANPGSVGFARDYPGMACYLLLDWEEDRLGLTQRRVSYDFEKTLSLLEAIGAPELVLDQLRRGRLLRG